MMDERTEDAPGLDRKIQPPEVGIGPVSKPLPIPALAALPPLAKCQRTTQQV
jgi:hypothetical protein